MNISPMGWIKFGGSFALTATSITSTIAFSNYAREAAKRAGASEDKPLKDRIREGGKATAAVMAAMISVFGAAKGIRWMDQYPFCGFLGRLPYLV